MEEVGIIEEVGNSHFYRYEISFLRESWFAWFPKAFFVVLCSIAADPNDPLADPFWDEKKPCVFLKNNVLSKIKEIKA